MKKIFAAIDTKKDFARSDEFLVDTGGKYDEKKRIFYYDLLKSIAIYLVCFYHFGALNIDFTKSAYPSLYFNYFLSGIASIGVPIFFMVNGALLLNKDYNIKNHIRKIVVVGTLYLVWGAITLAILTPVFGDHYSPLRFIKAIYNTKDGRTNHLWFLLAIMYIYMLFPLIKSMYDKNEKIYTYYLLALIFLFTFGITALNALLNSTGYLLNRSALINKDISPFILFNPFGIYFSYSLVYFIVGGWIAKFYKNEYLKATTCIFFFVISLFLLFLFGVMKTNVTGKVYDSVFYGYDSIMTLVMSITVFIICYKLEFKNSLFKNFITLISTNTLGIYFVHIPVGYLLENFLSKSILNNYLLFDLCYAFFLLFLSLTITLLLKKIPVVGKLVKI
ncbi:MAG TPA: acyltransferase family protein [Mucilaginibacter sp.]|jgi:surface polysaccharide O-acyltransferase-like enzyme